MKGKRENELEKVPDLGELQIKVKKQGISSVTININNSREHLQAIEHNNLLCFIPYNIQGRGSLPSPQMTIQMRN